MTIRFSCPKCQKSLNAPDAKAGAQVACPDCKNPLVVPNLVPPPPLPPARNTLPPVLAPVKADEPEAAKAKKPQQPSSPLEPIMQTWGKLPTPAKIGVAGGGLLFVFVMCCGGFAFVGSRFMGGGSGGSSDSPLDAAKLAREYDANRKAADAKYKGKTMTVTGVIDIPYKDGGFASVHLEVPDGLKSHPMVTADFSAAYEEDLRKLRRGDKIRFRGECEGDTSKPEHGPAINFINCELVMPGSNNARVSASGNKAEKPDRGGKGGKPPGKATHDLVAAKIRRGLTPSQVRAALGPPDDEKPFEMKAVVGNDGKVLSPAIKQLTYTYQSKDDGGIVILFKDGQVWGAESQGKGRIFP